MSVAVSRAEGGERPRATIAGLVPNLIPMDRSFTLALRSGPGGGAVTAEVKPERQRGEGFPGQRIVVLPRSAVGRLTTHPVLGRLLLTDIGYYPNALGHFFEREQGVNQAIFIYCTKGRGWCEFTRAAPRHRRGGSPDRAAG